MPQKQTQRHHTELECGLCGVVVTQKYAIDRQLEMTLHWAEQHREALVPAFDQDCWRTQIVLPLAYTPATLDPRRKIAE